MDAKHDVQDPPFRQVEGRLKVFEEETQDPLWKNLKRGKNCVNLQRTLQFGLDIYDFIMELDTEYRDAVLSKRLPFDPKFTEAHRGLLTWWLRPCERVEKAIREFEAHHFNVKHATEFRARFAEAKWILAPSRDAVGGDEMVDLRDEAIDEARKGVLAPLGE